MATLISLSVLLVQALKVFTIFRKLHWGTFDICCFIQKVFSPFHSFRQCNFPSFFLSLGKPKRERNWKEIKSFLLLHCVLGLLLLCIWRKQGRVEGRKTILEKKKNEKQINKKVFLLSDSSSFSRSLVSMLWQQSKINIAWFGH